VPWSGGAPGQDSSVERRRIVEIPSGTLDLSSRRPDAFCPPQPGARLGEMLPGQRHQRGALVSRIERTVVKTGQSGFPPAESAERRSGLDGTGSMEGFQRSVELG